LPRGVARELIGIIIHPLNRACSAHGPDVSLRATASCSPRISVTFMSAAGSLFARLYSGHTGVDPYTTAVSDTYQDLFGEGIFTGKDSTTSTPSPHRSKAPFRKRAALTRLVRGSARTSRARFRCRTGRRLSVERPLSRTTTAPLGPCDWQILFWSVSVSALAARSQAKSCASHRPVEDF
jgi:hypothetical protein